MSKQTQVITAVVASTHISYALIYAFVRIGHRMRDERLKKQDYLASKIEREIRREIKKR